MHVKLFTGTQAANSYSGWMLDWNLNYRLTDAHTHRMYSWLIRLQNFITHLDMHILKLMNFANKPCCWSHLGVFLLITRAIIWNAFWFLSHHHQHDIWAAKWVYSYLYQAARGSFYYRRSSRKLVCRNITCQNVCCWLHTHARIAHDPRIATHVLLSVCVTCS